jgi:tripartite-type tricarboxylate transporter receptor subunit TctC
MTPWYGLTAPRGTPAAIVDRLNAAVVAAIRSPETRERMMKVGYEPAGSTPQQLAEHIRAELARYAKLIKTIGFAEQ